MSRTYLAVPDAFTAAECDRIVALGEAAEGEPGPVYGSGGAHAVDRDRRDVRTVMLARDDGSEWLFDRLDGLFAAAAEAFALPVGPVTEPIQILRYDVGSHFATWHSDAGLDAVDRRRISMSLELSERVDYAGGELEIVPDLVGRPRTLPRGSAQLFPSRALHRVTPVSRGRRWALVAWTGAPQG
jgi:PKHD-type hydroxylase